MCDKGYAPGFAKSCSDCAGDEKNIALGFFITVTVLASVVVGFVIVDLVRVLDDSRVVSDRHDTLCWALVATLTDAAPLTGVKILVVVWQMVTQVSIEGETKCRGPESVLRFGRPSEGDLPSKAGSWSPVARPRALLSSSPLQDGK